MSASIRSSLLIGDRTGAVHPTRKLFLDAQVAKTAATMQSSPGTAEGLGPERYGAKLRRTSYCILPGPILNLTSHTPGYPIAWYNFIAATMTYTLFMLITRKQGWSIEQFKDHYENKHVPLVMEALKDALPVSHTRYYLKRNDAARGEADVAPPMVFAGDATTVDYDCITKIELRDEQHFKDFNVAFANAPGRAEIQADEEVFADKSKFRLFAIESTEVTKS